MFDLKVLCSELNQKEEETSFLCFEGHSFLSAALLKAENRCCGFSFYYVSLSAVCGPAELPAAAGHAVVRRLPGLEETTLGGQTGHLLHHWPPVSCLLTGMEGGSGSVRGE